MVADVGAGPTAVWDRGTLEIALFSGHLADVEGAAALAGANRLAVQTDAGGWEVIGFARAALVAPGRYRLTHLLRGLEGTVSGPASAGQQVLVLGAGTVSLSVEGHRIGESRALRVFAGAEDMAGQSVVVDLDAGPALPLAPVHLRAERLADGAVALRWTRRSRADGDGWGGAEPALEHVPEAWNIEIFYGPTLVRTLSSGTAGVRYGLPEQIADFGSAAATFDFAVAQVSPVLGAGHMGKGSFNG